MWVSGVGLQVPITSAKAAAIGSGTLDSAAKEFESLLLGQWLQTAESSFGAAPGGEDETDSSADQMRSYATQRLASQLTQNGGVGLAHLVKGALERQSAAIASSGSRATNSTLATAQLRSSKSAI